MGTLRYRLATFTATLLLTSAAFGQGPPPLSPNTPYDACPPKYRKWRPMPWMLIPGVGAVGIGWALSAIRTFTLPGSSVRGWPLAAAAPVAGPWLALGELHGAEKTQAVVLGIMQGSGIALAATSLFYSQRGCGDGPWLMSVSPTFEHGNAGLVGVVRF